MPSIDWIVILVTRDDKEACFFKTKDRNNYRTEIDGLRAVAIIPVILFHAGFDIVRGGFVGVDVFFVISGYLITSIILKEQKSGTFSLIGFYERRARRILPALVFVMAACVPFAYMWLSPPDLKGFFLSLSSIAVFSSNLLFLFESGYFSTAAELKPLLHTWSLSVEEQYYLMFPLILLFTARLGAAFSTVIGLLALASLAGAHYGAYHHPAANFFLLPTRWWELSIGALSALYFSDQERPVGLAARNILSALGLSLIAFAVLSYNKATPYPSFYALAPTIGAALIIVFASPATIVGRVLGCKALVGIGLISFSAYLWHQPLFAFARHQSLTVPSTAEFACLSVLSLMLAYITWLFIERPFRRKEFLSRGQLFSLAVASSSCLFGLGLYGTYKNGFRDRLPPNIQWLSFGEKLRATGDICKFRDAPAVKGLQFCEFGDLASKTIVFLYGDSHARALAGELHNRFVLEKVMGVRIALRDCNVIPEFFSNIDNLNDTKACTERLAQMLKYISSLSGQLIVSSRWTFRLFPVPDYIERLTFENKAGGAEHEDYRENLVLTEDNRPSISSAEKRRAVRKFLKQITESQVRTYLIYPVPEIGWDIGKLNFRYYQKTGQVLERIEIDYDEFLYRNRFVHEIFSEFSSEPNLLSIKPEHVFCNSFIMGKCVAQFQSRPFYYDDDHLSDDGAKLVVDEIFKAR